MESAMTSQVENLLALFRAHRHSIDTFRKSVEDQFLNHPNLFSEGRSIVHSTKSRIKDENHLRHKINRKIANGEQITEHNFFSRITDLAGVRVILLYQKDISIVDHVIRNKVDMLEDWCFAEDPKAYTWDPENVAYFKEIGITPEVKPSLYTSVHYLIMPHAKSFVRCEIQVRTLFEEIWGEVDHQLNYPDPSNSSALSEQIRVLSKIVGAGSRLLDSIYRLKLTD